MSYILGSHNSFSYHSPVKWYMKPFHFITKCQGIDELNQYDNGVRVFDLRVKLYKDEFYTAHGAMVFNRKAIDAICLLNAYKTETIYIRVILEYGKKCKQEIKNKFISFCSEIEKNYPDIIFFEGRLKGAWKTLYDFKNVFSIEHKYSSMTSMFSSSSKLLSILDDWIPLLYAKTHNKENYEIGTEKDILLIDFIEIGKTHGT